MANRSWLGRAKARAEEKTVQVTAYDAATTYGLTINGKSVSVIAAGSVNDTATALAEAWNEATEAEFAEVTAEAATDTVTFTGDTAGVPFTVSSGASGGTGTIGAATTTTVATGPNHADNAENWSGSTLPVDGDSIYLNNSSISILYGMDAFASVTPALVDIDASYTGFIGLPKTNAAGYPEYRPDYLQFDGATAVRIGAGAGNGSRRIKIDFGSTAFTASVLKSANGAEPGLPAVLLKGTHADNALEVSGGSVGVAFFGDEAATIKTLGVVGGSLVCGDGVTLNGTGSTAVVNGGQIEIRTVALSLTVFGGAATIANAGGATTLDIRSGAVCNHRGSGSSTTVSLAGTLDLTGDSSAVNLGTITLKRGGELRGVASRLTATIAKDAEVTRISAA